MKTRLFSFLSYLSWDSIEVQVTTASEAVLRDKGIFRVFLD